MQPDGARQSLPSARCPHRLLRRAAVAVRRRICRSIILSAFVRCCLLSFESCLVAVAGGYGWLTPYHPGRRTSHDVEAMRRLRFYTSYACLFPHRPSIPSKSVMNHETYPAALLDHHHRCLGQPLPNNHAIKVNPPIQKNFHLRTPSPALLRRPNIKVDVRMIIALQRDPTPRRKPPNERPIHLAPRRLLIWIPAITKIKRPARRPRRSALAAHSVQDIRTSRVIHHGVPAAIAPVIGPFVLESGAVLLELPLLHPCEEALVSALVTPRAVAVGAPLARRRCQRV